MPPNGFCLYPISAQITVGKRYNLLLKADTNIVKPGGTVNITANNGAVKIITNKVQISKPESGNIFKYHITIEANESNKESKITASIGKLNSISTVAIVPEDKDILYSEGILFEPGNINARPNQRRKVKLYVYIKMLPGGTNIRLVTDNPLIKLSAYDLIVNEALAVKHVVTYELEVWGEGECNSIIEAKTEDNIALLGVSIKYKEDPPKSNKGGVFNEHEYHFDDDPIQRTNYSPQTGKVIIYVNFPSVKYYLGEKAEYRSSLPSQVLIADLVAERCFYEIAKKKVSANPSLKPEHMEDKIRAQTYELSKKYGKKVHELLVDRKLFEEAKEKSKKQ